MRGDIKGETGIDLCQDRLRPGKPEGYFFACVG